MRANPPELRRNLGCGYEPALDGARPWQAPIEAGAEWWSTCPGYTTSLPETIDIARAWLHWSKGELGAFCDAHPCPALVGGIEVMAGTMSAFESFTMREGAKRGGRDGTP